MIEQLGIFLPKNLQCLVDVALRRNVFALTLHLIVSIVSLFSYLIAGVFKRDMKMKMPLNMIKKKKKKAESRHHTS